MPVAAIPLNAEAVANAKAYPDRFVQACRIVKESEEKNSSGAMDQIGLLTLQPQQAQALAAVIHHRWVMVSKYRQAKISTVMALWLLGQIQYNRGLQGVFIAERYETAETVWNRATYAYENLPAEIRIPLKGGTTAGKRELRFTHNGAVRVVTGGGKAPAIGNSPDVMVVTEYPDVPDPENFNQHVFPTVNKRPNARVVFEHTPGLFGTIPHTMWLKALDGKSRFHPVFLKWWLDPSVVPIDDDGNRVDCSTLVPTNEELAIIEQLPGVTKAGLMFRRLALDTEFAGDVDLFRHKYPFDAYDGWVLTTNPAIPQDAVRWLLPMSVVVRDDEEKFFEDPEEDEDVPYMITADPAGFGDTGDPSALTVWNCWDKREVACWAGREDPGLFADRIWRFQKRYGVARTRVVVESNKGECAAILRDRGCQNMHHTNDMHPGFYTTHQTKVDGRTALVELLRQGELNVRTRATLHQILQWDGEGRKKRSKTAEGTHHFDRAMTCSIAAYMFRKQNFGMRPAPRRLHRGMSVAYLDHLFPPKRKKKVLGIATG